MTEKATEKVYDIHFMNLALTLAKRGLGYVAPNPSVGCLIVQEPSSSSSINMKNSTVGHVKSFVPMVVGRGWTGATENGVHAEIEALRQAGQKAKGATVYVTLEPCSHHGHTPPCTKALIDSGVRRVVIAITDPNPKVNGNGIRALKDAGISVEVGLCKNQASYINEGFFLVISNGRPMVTLKSANSLDGKIALKNGQSRWITNDKAREKAHIIRMRHDAVMIGVGSAIKDDPMLTCRIHEQYEKSRIRIVVDGALRLPIETKLVQSARRFPLWIITSFCASAEKKKELEELNVKCISIGTRKDTHFIEPELILKKLANLNITRLLIEGGPTLTTSFIEKEFIDKVEWFFAPVFLGEDARSSVCALENQDLSKINHFRIYQTLMLDNNILLRMRKFDSDQPLFSLNSMSGDDI